MGFFVAMVLVGLGAINMGFQQGQDNPKSESFFESNANIKYKDQKFLVDER